jgi:hypothetical protein
LLFASQLAGSFLSFQDLSGTHAATGSFQAEPRGGGEF